MPYWSVRARAPGEGLWERDLKGQGNPLPGVFAPGFPRAPEGHAEWGAPSSRHWAGLHTGRAQQSAQGWAGPWPAGRSGGRRRRGRPPPPFSLPATAVANHQAGARPWRGLPRPRNSQTPSFRGKKNQSSWQRGGQWWPSRRSGSHAGPRGVRGHARVPIAIPSRARRAGRRVDRGGREHQQAPCGSRFAPWTGR